MIRESTLECVHSASSHGKESEEIVQKRAKERREGDGASQMLVRASVTRCTELIICTAGRSNCDNARMYSFVSLILLLVLLPLLFHIAHMVACSIGVWPIGVGRFRVNTMPVRAECVIYLLVASFYA